MDKHFHLQHGLAEKTLDSVVLYFSSQLYGQKLFLNHSVSHKKYFIFMCYSKQNQSSKSECSCLDEVVNDSQNGLEFLKTEIV